MRFGERTFETTTTEGTGAYALAGAGSGHQTFLDGIGAGDYVAYICTDGDDWEVGYGTLSSGPATLTREEIFDSSNAGAEVNWTAGTRNIYCAPIASVLTSQLKTHIGTAAPAWLPTGALWVDNTATPWLLKIKRSGGSTTLGRIDATNNRFVVEGAKGADIASAGSIDIGAATGDFVHITGTTTITALGTVAAGVERTLVFDGALTLTHNATSLILFGGANIATTAGAVVIVRSEGSGNWRQVGGWRANGKPWAAIASADMPAATTSAQGAVELAVLAEVQARTDTGRVPAIDVMAAAGMIGMVLLGTLTTTSGATASLTGIPASLKGIYISIEGVSCSASSSTFEMVVSHDNGSSYSTSGYDYQTNSAGEVGDTSFGFKDAITAGTTIKGFIRLEGIGTGGYKAVKGFSVDSTGATRQFDGIYSGGSLAAINAVRFRFNTGNFDAGRIQVYGF